MNLPTDAEQPGTPAGLSYQEAQGRRSFVTGSLSAAALGALGLSGPVQATNASEGAAEVAPEGLEGAASFPWMKSPGAPFIPYGQPSVHEQSVVRSIGANRAVPGNGASFTPLEDLAGTITPSGLHYERHHNGVPQVDPARHRLVIHGLVNRALSFSDEALLRYPQHVQQLFIECGGNSASGWNSEPAQKRLGALHGLVSCSEWAGVPLRLLLREAQAQAGDGWLIAEGADAAAMRVSIPMEKALDDCFIGLFQNGERLRPEQGYPMRLIVPGWTGVLHVKWLRSLEIAREPAMSRYETAKYTELLPDGKSLQFAFLNEIKSTITSPSHGQQIAAPGWLEIRGLAWSGRGRVTSVEVSVDGGAQWAQAHLHGPVLPRCFTRFTLPWVWDGKESVVMSRAIDETGNRQPERRQMIARRGAHADYRNNAIVSWQIDESGRVRHVYA